MARPPVGARRPARLLRASVRAARTRGGRQGHREHVLGHVARDGGRRHRLLVREVERSEPERLPVLHVRRHVRARGVAEPVDRPGGLRGPGSPPSMGSRGIEFELESFNRAFEVRSRRPTVRPRAGRCPDDRAGCEALPPDTGFEISGRDAPVPDAAAARRRRDLGAGDDGDVPGSRPAGHRVALRLPLADGSPCLTSVPWLRARSGRYSRHGRVARRCCSSSCSASLVAGARLLRSTSASSNGSESCVPSRSATRLDFSIDDPFDTLGEPFALLQTRRRPRGRERDVGRSGRVWRSAPSTTGTTRSPPTRRGIASKSLLAVRLPAHAGSTRAVPRSRSARRTCSRGSRTPSRSVTSSSSPRSSTAGSP